MAEGYLRKFTTGDHIYSAGIEVHGLNPLAVAVMREDDVDISHQTSNHIDEYAGIDFDVIITVCDNAREQCPVFPSRVRQVHKDFADPSKLKGTAEEVLPAYRKARDDIRAFIRQWLADNE